MLSPEEKPTAHSEIKTNPTTLLFMWKKPSLAKEKTTSAKSKEGEVLQAVLDICDERIFFNQSIIDSLDSDGGIENVKALMQEILRMNTPRGFQWTREFLSQTQLDIRQAVTQDIEKYLGIKRVIMRYFRGEVILETVYHGVYIVFKRSDQDSQKSIDLFKDLSSIIGIKNAGLLTIKNRNDLKYDEAYSERLYLNRMLNLLREVLNPSYTQFMKLYSIGEIDEIERTSLRDIMTVTSEFVENNVKFIDGFKVLMSKAQEILPKSTIEQFTIEVELIAQEFRLSFQEFSAYMRESMQKLLRLEQRGLNTTEERWILIQNYFNRLVETYYDLAFLGSVSRDQQKRFVDVFMQAKELARKAKEEQRSRGQESALGNKQETFTVIPQIKDTENESITAKERNAFEEAQKQKLVGYKETVDKYRKEKKLSLELAKQALNRRNYEVSTEEKRETSLQESEQLSALKGQMKNHLDILLKLFNKEEVTFFQLKHLIENGLKGEINFNGGGSSHFDMVLPNTTVTWEKDEKGFVLNDHHMLRRTSWYKHCEGHNDKVLVPYAHKKCIDALTDAGITPERLDLETSLKTKKAKQSTKQ